MTAAALILLSVWKTSDGKQNERSVALALFSDELEEKLEALCVSVDGVRRATVLLTLDTSEEYVLAKDLERNGDYIKTSTVGTESGGIELYVVSPKVRGVAVVCTGGDRPAVQKKIVSLISASLGIPTSKVSVAGG